MLSSMKITAVFKSGHVFRFMVTVCRLLAVYKFIKRGKACYDTPSAAV